MMSPVQLEALRSVVVAALAGVPTGVPQIGASACVWGPVDHGELAAPWCVMRQIAAEQLDTGDDEQTDAAGVTRMRSEYEVTVEIQLAAARDDSAPTHAQSATVLVRRLATRLCGASAATTLADAGCPVVRIAGIRDLTTAAPGPTQWQSRWALDVVLRIAVIESDDGTIVERVLGRVDVEGPPGDTITSALDAEV